MNLGHDIAFAAAQEALRVEFVKGGLLDSDARPDLTRAAGATIDVYYSLTSDGAEDLVAVQHADDPAHEHEPDVATQDEPPASEHDLDVQPGEVTEEQAWKAARDLAKASGFPRYDRPTDPDKGARKLMESVHDVDLAFRHASIRTGGDPLTARQIANAQGVLRHWHDRPVSDRGD